MAKFKDLKELGVNEYDPHYVYEDPNKEPEKETKHLTELEYLSARQIKSKARKNIPLKSEIDSKLPIHARCMDVPEWARYDAVDEDGTEWLFEYEPIPCESGKWIPSQGRCIPRFRIIKNWRETLRKFTAVDDLKNLTPKQKSTKKRTKSHGRYKKKKKLEERESLAKFNKKMQVTVNNKLMFNNLHKKWRIYKIVDGENLYCTGSIQISDKEWGYRFYSMKHKKLKKRIKLFATEAFVQMAIDAMVESGVATADELHVDFWLYSKSSNGEFTRVPTVKMERYYRYLQKLEEWKNERKSGRVESNSTDEEEDDYECEDEGNEEGDISDDFDE